MEKDCNRCYQKAETTFNSIFEKYGRIVARYPFIFIISSFLISGGLGVGLLSLSPEDDVEKVYTPKDNQASKDRAFMLETYPDLSASNYSSRTLRDGGLHADIIVKSKDGSDILNMTNLDEFESVYNSVSNISVQINTSTFYFNDLCARSHLGCVVSGAFVFTSSFKADITRKAATYPVYNHATHGTVSLPYFLGDVTLNGDYLSSAKYARIRFHVQKDLKPSIEWLGAFLTHMESLQSDRLDIAYSHAESLGEELDKNTQGDIVYVSLTFAMMIFYAIFAISGGNCVSNRGFLATAGVFCTALAIMAAIGFVSACGVKFVAIVGVMPFLVLGIGMDDMFILLSGLAEVQHLDTVEERIAKTMASAGLAITITSLTDLLAFCVGSLSVFLGVQNFCIYTGVAVVFCYLNQLTLFTGCMVLHERRVLASRHSITCMVTQPRETMEDNDVSEMAICCCSGSSPKTRDEVEGISERYPRKILTRVLQYPSVRVIVLFLFGLYLGIAIWGATNIEEGLQLKDTVADTSYYHKFGTFRSHLSFQFTVSFVFKKGVQYWTTQVREDIEALISSAQAHSLIHDQYSLSWIRDFTASAEFNDSSEVAFVSALKTFLETSTSHVGDVVIKNNTILSSRVYVLTENLKTTNDQSDLMTGMRKEAEMSGMSVMAYHPIFVFYEQYTAILSSTLQTVGIAIAAVFVATFLFMPHPLMLVYVLLTVIMIMLGLFGFMYFWQITLSSITMIILIMGVGFAIDYSIHTSHAFIQSNKTTRLEKMTHAISMAAAPIVNAALSSFIGILMLLLSKSYVFRTFFKIMFLVIVLGFAHSTFFLPSLLSFLGPIGSSTKENFEKNEQRFKYPTRHNSRARISPFILPDRNSLGEMNLNHATSIKPTVFRSRQVEFKLPRPNIYLPNKF